MSKVSVDVDPAQTDSLPGDSVILPVQIGKQSTILLTLEV